MPTISLTIPALKLERVLNAMGYTPELGDKSIFIKREIIALIKSKVAVEEKSKIEPSPEPIINVDDLNIS